MLQRRAVMFFTDGVLLFFLLLLWLALIQETSSSSINDSDISNNRQDSTDISVLSSLSANASSSWLSPSGRFSFGFYPDGDGFFIGIQLLVSSSETRVVWTARPDMKPFPKDAVFDFTPQGFFITPKRGSSSPITLFNFTSLASYAAMLDNGNLVVFSTNSSNIQQNSDVSLVGGVAVTTVTERTTGTTATTATTVTTATTTATTVTTATTTAPGKGFSALNPNKPVTTGCFEKGTPNFNCNPYNRDCRGSCQKDSPPIYRSANSSVIIWRSFNYPTDTILGSQTLPCDHNLTSSAGLKSHSIGVHVLSMQCEGNLVIHSISSGDDIWDSKTSGEDYRSLVLNEDGRLYLSSFTGNQRDISGYKPQNITAAIIYAATLDSDNYFRLYAINLDDNSTQTVNVIPYYMDKCQEIGICGANSYCTLANSNPECSCMPGFEFINRGARAAGCQRSRALPSCEIGSGAGHFSINAVENIAGLDELAYSIASAQTADECSSRCVDDCDCYAAVFREQRCSKLKLPLARGRKDPHDPSIAFIKLAAEAGQSRAGSVKRKREVRVVAIIVCSIVAGVIWLAVIAACKEAYWHLFVKFREQWDKWELALEEEIAPCYFSYDEIPKDPKSKIELGKGAHGTVFKAALPIGGHSVDVAVKRLHGGTGEEAERDFRAEMSLIGRARHTNLVRLLGFCYDGFIRVLVYEYMSEGSLADHIFNLPKLRPDWARRLRLLLGAARGIHYLHCECESKIIHRDIKPENILVSKDWTAKISDFGLAKQVSAKQTRAATLTVAAGTDGYVAPECEKVDESTREVMLTEKVDVYSYGVVVLETVCGKRNNKEGELQKHVREALDKGEVCALWEGEQVEASELERVVNMGMMCVQEDPGSRPTMEEVVMILEEVMKL